MSTWVRSLASPVGWGSSVTMSYSVGHRHSSDPALLWLWCSLAATALIGPLAWGTPYATGTTLKRKINKQTNKQTKFKSLLVKFARIFSYNIELPEKESFVSACHFRHFQINLYL